MSQVKYIWVAALVALGVCVAGCSSDEGELELSAKQEQVVAERLAPAGNVALEGETGSVVAVSSSSEPRTGEEIYNTKCMTCHATGAAGAPILGNADQWSPRIAQGIDTLYANAIGGIRGMPAKGLCMDCSDDEMHAAVDYMVENSQ